MYNETEYWLELLFRSEYIEEKPYISVVEDCRELIRLLISIVKTSKELPKKTNQLSIEDLKGIADQVLLVTITTTENKIITKKVF